MGADISLNLMPGVDSNNLSGFWESNDIYAIHNKLFKSIGIEWFNLSSEIIKDGDEAALSEFKNAAEDLLIEEFSRTRILVIKDPRICILAPYWIESIRSVNALPVAVIPIRNPMEVATSLRARDNMDINYGLFLWLRHFLDSERHTRNLARSFCSFNDLLADWKGTVKKISMDISIEWPSTISEVAEQVEAFLSLDSKHYNISDQEFMLDDSIPDLVKRAYVVALDLVKNGESDNCQQEIDDIAALVDSIEVFTCKRLVARDQMTAYLEAEVVENREEQARLNKLLTEQSARAQIEIGEKVEAILQLSDENSSLQQIMSEKVEAIQQLSDENSSLQQIMSEKIDAIQQLSDENSSLQQIMSEKVEAIQQLSDKNSSLLQITRQKEELLQEMLKNSKTLHQENDEKEKIIRELKNELNRLQQYTASLQDDIASLLRSRSWRVTAPIRWLLHLALSKSTSKVGKILGLGGIFRVEPMFGLQKTEKEGCWKSTCGDPQFDVYDACRVVTKGWYQFQIKTPSNQLNPTLYYDYGDGYSEVNKKRLTRRSDGYGTLIYFNHPPVAIRIDPTDEEGVWFELSHVVVMKTFLPHVLWRYGRQVYIRERESGRGRLDIVLKKAGIIKRLGFLYVMRNFDVLTSSISSNESSNVDYSEWIDQVEQSYFKQLNYSDDSSIKETQHIFFLFTDSLDEKMIHSSVKGIIDQSLTKWVAYIFLSSRLKKQVRSAELYRDSRIELLFSDNYSQQHSQMCETIDANGGAFVTLLKVNCQLVPKYIEAVSQAMLEQEKASSIYYSDNDLIGMNGRFAPSFKPEWSPDYFLEYDYIGPVCTVSANILSSTLKLVDRDAGDYAWQLLMQAAINNLDARVFRIPFVLWHEYKIMEDGDNNDLKSLLHDSRRTLLRTHLNRKLPVSVKSTSSFRTRISYNLPGLQPSVEIIIPTRDQVKLLKTCITSLIKLTEYSNYHITIVNNRSSERATIKYFESLEANEKISIEEFDFPFNYSAINNKIALKSNKEIVCFMNNDIEVTNQDWLTSMISQAVRPDIGCVGAKLIYPGKKHIQHAGVIIGLGGVAGHAYARISVDNAYNEDRINSVQNYSAVTAACMVMKTQLFKDVKGFDEKNLAVAFNDVDLCLRVLEAGYRNVWTPYAELIHHESISRGSESSRIEEFQKEVLYMRQRWKSIIHDDPAYNPNLSLNNEESFSISLRQLGSAAQAENEAANPALNPYALASSEQRISDVFRRQNGEVKVAGSKVFRPGLSIVILTLDKPELIGPLLHDLIDAKVDLDDQFPIQIIVGDTGSTSSDVSAIYSRVEDDVTIVKGLNYHFSACNNQLFSEYVEYGSTLFLNNDIIFDDAVASLNSMYKSLNGSKSISVVGTYLLYPDNRLQHGGISVIEEGDLKGLCYHPGHREEFKKPDIEIDTSYPAVTGACLMIESILFRQLGMFDELYCAEAQDVDLCFSAVRLGRKVGLIYAGKILHLENSTRKTGEVHNSDRARFVRKWAMFYEAILKS